MKTSSTFWLSLVRFANRQTRNSRALRRTGILAYSNLVRANRFLPPPRVLLNGPPKSGTHLLSDCVALVPRMMFSGRHFALSDFFSHPDKQWDTRLYSPGANPALDEARLGKFLGRCPQGMFVTAHAGAHPNLRRLLKELGFQHILLLRDPRDIVVSHAFYVKREPLHDHYRYYTETLESDEERIMASIRGFGRSAAVDTPLLSVEEIFAGFIPWLDDPSTLVIRFEDLVGPRGGGYEEKQLASIRKIGKAVGRPIDKEQAQQIAQKMYGKGGLTFRKGQTGDWRNHFTEAHRHAFKEVAGDSLIKLGYESSLRW